MIGPEADRQIVFEHVKTRYNPLRLHQTLGDMPPNKFKSEYSLVIAAWFNLPPLSE